ncbi:hypothetical protein ES319_A05G081600v1 [Gossypium barbadense]|uniref:BHLH domain-containing protein n=1 Tax=Gossypium barbadense TaxID=3634 RepID=A0A2P5X797_GOSBA|nr:hypothetical protein ES319_A05G081600v1 [Gossypium barbadense]PPR99213.1 hypothetical protein GOBAR_AA21452 [Gossypium barbadense]
MSGLLKEALKSLCGVTQWSYAVFWKIGCRNTKLLIWEEYYYESTLPGLRYPELLFQEWGECCGSDTSSQLGCQPWDKVGLLISKMMNNCIVIVGQGLVGRAAFTGNHQWILANSYMTDSEPPEVLNELHLQFSAAMQTVAVIPVFPHGVLQLGSSTTIMENMGFVNDVKSLILCLGCIPGSLFSDSCGTSECVENIGIPISMEKPVSMDSAGIYWSTNSSILVTEGCNQQSRSECVENIGIPISMEKTVSIDSAGIYWSSQASGIIGESSFPTKQIQENQTLWLNPHVSFCNSQSEFNCQPVIGQSAASHSNLKSMEKLIVLDTGLQNHITNSTSTSNSQNKPKPIPDIVPSLEKLEDVTLSIPANQLSSIAMFSGVSNQGHDSEDSKRSRADVVSNKESKDNGLFQAPNIPLLPFDDGLTFGKQLPSKSFSTRSPNSKYEDACIKPPSRDDLFDVLGADLKSKLLDGKLNNALAQGPDSKMQNIEKDTWVFRDMHNVYSDTFTANEGITDQGTHSSVVTDHLLDAVVSSAQSTAKQILDDDESCRTTLTNFSNSSVQFSSPTFGRVNIFNQVERELHGGLPKSSLKGGTPTSCSFRSGCSKDDAGTCSQTTSLYGSQISSLVELGHTTRHNSSLSTAYSKRNDETSKPNRKRLKPGENPRPRPKDRQMIQDRVKELREIVPNGAKCSIDALLEKTIKHMLFMQSVTKHADKIKHMGESKIKENFKGGTTWAFEVGSRSMICPIIVEDLNPPRQMLVEMLCEEQGFFLEIADLIRGMGLTILKGVMETRNDKIWACFAVEANRDVTRVEIFMSLVRLLEQTVKGCTSLANGLDSNNMMVQQSFPQAASIPATGTASSLQ